MPDTHECATPPVSKRCAVYTRVSVDGGDKDGFGSTDAQFMACHELITSQLREGWQPIKRLYEDKGESGSHLGRPGLQSLLEDIRLGLVDIVVVHRLDRLTRHLRDLQELVTIFEHHAVALVCVTQSIDTAHSHGRLAINLLTSFAQFERELIGERIRDQRAATRRNGLWHGSAAPLGYVIAHRRLVVDSAQAEIVRDIFRNFVSQPSVTDLVQDLARQGIKTKRWKTKSGQAKGGRLFDKNALYKVLNNRIYLGELFYDNEWHSGEHDAIVSSELWEQAHAVMASRARRTGVRNRTTQDDHFLLKGMLVGTDGHAMTPCLSSPYLGRRYAYYVPQRDISVGAGESGLPRIAAGKLHASVWLYLRSCLRQPDEWFDALSSTLTQHPTFDRRLVAERLQKLEAKLDEFFPVVQKKLFRQLIEQVVVGKDSFTVRANLKGIFDLMIELLDERYLAQLRERLNAPGEH
jgi:DNA invertase Pin-like site-specific DNA recombinase